jgi:sugar phosphate isomerase/epimerase
MSQLTLGYLTLSADPAETVTAAASAGFPAVGIRITGRRKADDYPKVIGNRAAIADIRRRAEDGGVRLSNVSAYHFYEDVTHDDLARVVETVAELGAGIIVSNKYVPEDEKFLDLLVPYAQAAQKAGIRLAIEFMKYSEAKTIHKALELAERSGQANVGMLIDPLHMDRAGATNVDVAAIPPERIVFVQLCDALKRRGDPTLEMLASEAPRADHAGLPLERRAALAYQVFRDYLDTYAASRGFSYDW